MFDAHCCLLPAPTNRNQPLQNSINTIPPPQHRERPAAKTALQQQLERLGVGLFLFAMVLGVVVFAVNRFQCVGLLACARTNAPTIHKTPPP